MCRQVSGKVPGIFIESILQWLCATEQLGDRTVSLLDIELVFLLLGVEGFLFPFQLDGSTNWAMRSLESLFQRPTLTLLLRPVQTAMQQLFDLFPEAIARISPSPAKELGVYMSFWGIRVCMPELLLQQAQERLKRFTQSRAVRKTADLARPVT